MRVGSVRIAVGAIASFLSIMTISAAADSPGVDQWPQQGGVDRNFVVPARPLDVEALASGKPKLVYAVNAGFGICAPIVVDGKLYSYGLYPPDTTPETIDNPDSYISCSDAFSNPQKKPALRDEELPDSPPYATEYGGPRGEEWLVCRDASTGKMIWASKLTDQAFAYRANNIVSDEASPLMYDGKVYVHVLTGHLFCIDAASGKVQWDRSLYDTHMYQWAQKQGDCAGPVAAGDTVVVSTNGSMNLNYSMFGNSCMVAAGFDTRTGRTRWVTTIPLNALRPNNGRLALATVDGKPQVIVPCGRGTAGLDPGTGDIVWSWDTAEKDVPFPWTSYAPVVWQPDRQTYVFDAVDAAHDDKESGSRVLSVNGNKAELLWQSHDFKPYSMIQKANVVAKDGRIYGFDSRTYGNEEGGTRQKGLPEGRGHLPDGQYRFQCRDFKTGKLLWSTNDFGPDHGVTTPAYELLAGDILFLTHSSGLYVGRVRDDGIAPIAHVAMRGVGDLAEPVLVGSRLFVRQQDLSANGAFDQADGKANLFCIDLSK